MIRLEVPEIEKLKYFVGSQAFDHEIEHLRGQQRSHRFIEPLMDRQDANADAARRATFQRGDDGQLPVRAVSLGLQPILEIRTDIRRRIFEKRPAIVGTEQFDRAVQPDMGAVRTDEVGILA
ncbi:hypothetical protein [Roseivivax lentus]|uniref:hypothetical protein n=1 Tax=Roseivivax lentus TaxID=633194 RepID=UPI0013564370|nr:hypothetical protein [Roseivivax lentus]